jgi:hypothetical protein
MATRKCSCGCKRPATGGNGITFWATIECAISIAERRNQKKKAAVKRAEEQDIKSRKERLKPRSEWMREAQAAFNAFIRARDDGLPCICCGKLANDEGWKPGGSWDAGHYLSRGAYPELRFEETNCHRQLKSCNGGAQYARKGRTVSEGYRIGLIDRIGLQAVEWLEGPHESKKYTIEDLKGIKREYKQKLRDLIADG